MKYICALILALVLAVVCVNCWASTNEEVAQAIWSAEGGEKASKPYGILSVPCDSKESCKVICLNTIRNQRVRHSEHNCGLSFLECLSKRYAPVNCENDNGTNKFWLRNVKYFLENE